MKKRAKHISYTVLSLVLVLAVIGLLVFFQLFRPHLRFAAESDKAQMGDSSLSQTEWRDLCHDCIRWRDHHDAYLRLIEVGDDTSIPYLIDGLNRLGDTQMCSRSHCIEALETISGEKFGGDVSAWENWYADR